MDPMRGHQHDGVDTGRPPPAAHRVDETLAMVESLLARAPSPRTSPDLDPATIRWLCLVPVWTPSLARRCSMPGWDERRIAAVLAAWQNEGLVETTQAPLAIDETGQVRPAQHLFWVPRHARPSWLSRIVADDGQHALAELAGTIARRIMAQPDDGRVPVATWRWAVVAAHATATPPSLGPVFERALDTALSDGRPDEAWLWIEAVQRVAEVVPGEATTLHQRAVRRLALFDRQRIDRAILHDYLPREALFAAFRDLVDGPDTVGGLPYLGGGGVGKTMLMRALRSGTAAHMPAGFEPPATVTARIDFDHVNPDYPARRPGLLFAHLAEELRLKDDSLRGAEAFGLLFNRIALLHERVDRTSTPDEDVDGILDVFAWACEPIAAERHARIVLLLDTCEELARLGTDGRLPDSVSRTFDLLERLHARMPSLRVVLCGRRPLAGTYADGETVSVELPQRSWLRLHRVSAFSEEEARAYLQKTGVPDALVPPILARSIAAASSATLGLTSIGGSGPEGRPGPEESGAGSPSQAVAIRYSPFSLSVYATWIARQPQVDPEDIAGDRVDHFVRIRILDRISNADVRRFLPHVALLGRFDEPTLRACVDLRPDVADAVLREIGSQEWVDRQAGGYYTVEPELRARLLRYFEREEPAELNDARCRVLPALWTLLERTPATQTPDEAVVQALLRLVQHDPAALLRAWRTLDARIVQRSESNWGVRVLGRVLADEDAPSIGNVDAGAWSALVTTYAECVLHAQGPAQAADLWHRAWEGGRALPDGPERALVLVRIASGGLASVAAIVGVDGLETWALRLYDALSDYARTAGEDYPPATGQRMVQRLEDDPVSPHYAPSSAIAALMACADAIERHPDSTTPAPPILERIAALVVMVPHVPSRALALTCVGRFAARRQDADLALRRFIDALDALASCPDRDLPSCLQWPSHLDASSWVTLEAMRGLVGLEPVETTLGRFAAVPAATRETAANRLESLQRRLTAAVRVPDTSGAQRVVKVAHGDIALPESLGQELVAPRAVAMALDDVEAGRAGEGLRLLAEMTSRATSARNTAVAHAVERARVEAVTRMRLGELGRLGRHLDAGPAGLPIEERERMRAFMPGADASPNHDESASTRWEAHALWRARRTTSRDATRLAEVGRRLLTGPTVDGQGEWARASVALDLVECSELGVDVDLADRGLTPVSPEEWWGRHPASPERALRLWIRSAALDVAPGGPSVALVQRVGVRRSAALAMEEGELLALRLPAPALKLLGFALVWFEDAHDAIGVWQVTTLLALTRIRAGVPRDNIHLASLRAAHEAVARMDAVRGVPPWAWIEQVSSLPFGDATASSDWAAWLHRVVALHHWVEGGVRPEVLFTRTEWLPVELREWPLDASSDLGTSETRLSGSTTSSGSGVATAARRVPPSSPAPSSGRTESSPAPLPQAASRTSRARAIVAIGGVLLTAAVLASMVLSAGTPNHRAQPPPSMSEPPDGVHPAPPIPDNPGADPPPVIADAMVPSSLPTLGVLAALLAVAGGVTWLVRRRASVPTIATATRVAGPWSVRIATAGTASLTSSGHASALDTVVSVIDDAGSVVVSAPLRVRRTDTFSGLDAIRQPPAGTALSSAYADRSPTRAWLEVTLATAWPSWEVLLWSGALEGTHLRPAVVRHVHPSRQLTGSTPVRDVVSVGTIAATAADQRQAAYAWEPAVRARRVTVAPVDAEHVREGVPLAGIRLVHVTARPVETPQGLFLEISGGESLTVMESLESLASDRGTLFDASQLAHAFPDVACVLLQPPRRPTLDLTPAGREPCAWLRVVGASLAEQGVPLVIVLPPMDGELAAHLVRLLGRRAPDLRPGAEFDAHEFTMRARELVIDYAQRLLSRDAAIELALQVVVYG